MQIHVRVFSTPVAKFLPGPKGPGKRRVFSNDLELVSVDGVAQALQHVGSLSGFVTTLRIAKANDNLYPFDSHLIQYEASYLFNAVPPLQKGQVIVRGLLYLDAAFDPVDPPKTAAIVGGTDAYRLARGQVIEGGPTGDDRVLDIQL